MPRSDIINTETTGGTEVVSNCASVPSLISDLYLRWNWGLNDDLRTLVDVISKSQRFVDAPLLSIQEKCHILYCVFLTGQSIRIRKDSK